MLPKNILVAYHGGGYDGCLWEWNFFAVDSRGNVHNFARSGALGAKGPDDCSNIYENIKNYHGYIYELTEERFSDFTANHNPLHVLRVLEYLNTHRSFPPVFARCKKCGGKITRKTGGQLIDWHGCGGIASAPDGLICAACYTSGTCIKCGEYDETTAGNDGFCDYCLKEKTDDFVQSLADRCTVIEYSEQNNNFIAAEFPVDEISDNLKTMWKITLHAHGGEKNIAVQAENEKQALDYAIEFCYGLEYPDYYTAMVEPVEKIFQEENQ